MKTAHLKLQQDDFSKFSLNIILYLFKVILFPDFLLPKEIHGLRAKNIAKNKVSVSTKKVILLAKFRVEIDHNICQGFGTCVELYSQFKLDDDDRKSHVEGARIVSNREIVELYKLDCLKKAAETYPVNAIHIINLETNEKLI
jgi:ferredoxin